MNYKIIYRKYKHLYCCGCLPLGKKCKEYETRKEDAQNFKFMHYFNFTEGGKHEKTFVNFIWYLH